MLGGGKQNRNAGGDGRKVEEVGNFEKQCMCADFIHFLWFLLLLLYRMEAKSILSIVDSEMLRNVLSINAKIPFKLDLNYLH